MSQVHDYSTIVVFGETGVGKSSLINMLAGEEVAVVSGMEVGCTPTNISYEIHAPIAKDDFSRTKYVIWDTAGLNEGELGTSPPREAFNNLLGLAKGHSINLLMYCIRGSRFTTMVRVNYDLFWGIVCDGRVPIVLVVTGLEQEDEMDRWWKDNNKIVKEMGMTFQGHACVTTIKGREEIYDEEFRKSTEKVWRLIKEHCNESRTITPEWLARVPERVEGYMSRYNARTGNERDMLAVQTKQESRKVSTFPQKGTADKSQLKVSHENVTNASTNASASLDGSITHNVIVFGETGAGKSSIVNQILGERMARVSSSAGGCTFDNNFYETTIANTAFRIYDTAGLNEGDQGRIPHWEAIQGLYNLIWQLDGVSLLIYCMRGRVKENSKANWNLFNKVICGEQVPIIAVVTGLENEHDPEDWWRTKENQKTFERYRMAPRAVGCIVSVLGKRNEHQAKYEHSRTRLHELIKTHYKRKPWCEEKEKWFESIYQTAYTTRICFFPRTRLEYTKSMRGVFDEFVSMTDMDATDSEKLEATLLKAEKKMRKGRRN